MAKPTDITPDTANEILFDSSLRHQIGIRRFAAGEAKEAVRLLEISNTELLNQLRERLKRFEGRPADFTSKRFRALSEDIRSLRREMIKEQKRFMRRDLKELAIIEQDFELRMMQVALPVEIEFATVSSQTLRSLVTTKPFSGGAHAARTLDQWYSGIAAADQKRILEAVQLGMIQGESIDDIMARIGSNNVLGLTKANIEAVVRTSVNHVSNAAREELWQANDDIIDFLRWNATLDGRTTRVCSARDGKLDRVNPDAVLPAGTQLLEPPKARPPAHPNCRSIMTAVFSSEGVADKMPDRPFVKSIGRRPRQGKDFRKIARDEEGTKNWSKLSAGEKNKLVKFQKDTWAEGAIGTVPGETNYDKWLRKQDTKFQNEVLGKGKAQAFRKGLKMDQFVDRKGQELSLVELERTHSEFF